MDGLNVRLYRAKSTENKGWVYGYLYRGKPTGRWYIVDMWGAHYQVCPKTVGQNTAVKDAENKEIYEGDVLTYNNGNRIGGVYYVWEGNEAGSYYVGGDALNSDCVGDFRIVGNIHDRPNILAEIKKEKEDERKRLYNAELERKEVKRIEQLRSIARECLQGMNYNIEFEENVATVVTTNSPNEIAERYHEFLKKYYSNVRSHGLTLHNVMIKHIF